MAIHGPPRSGAIDLRRKHRRDGNGPALHLGLQDFSVAGDVEVHRIGNAAHERGVGGVAIHTCTIARIPGPITCGVG